MPTPAVLFAGLIFGVIGIAGFSYGRKNASWKPMLIGLALIAFPYFVSEVRVLYAIGFALSAALYFWRD